MKALVKSSFDRSVRKITGPPSHLRKSVRCNHAWYGNSYGGFHICPDLLSGNSIVYSVGIGEDMSFDHAVRSRHDCPVYCFDPTPKSIDWFKRQKPDDKFRFYEFGLSDRNGFVDFYLPKNPDHVSGSSVTQTHIDLNKRVRVEMKTLGSIMNELGHTHIDVLKMDIEGSEYEVIADILNAGLSVNQILVEFHDRLFENGHQKSIQTVALLKRHGFEIFAISDTFLEVSFIHNKAL